MATKAFLSMSPYFTIFDDNGIPCPGGKCYTYAAGTTNPKDTYTDYDSGITQTNPIIADAGGRLEMWLASDGLYKLTFTDQYDNNIRTIDNVGIGGVGVNMTVNTVVGATDSLKSLGEAAALSVVTLGYRTAGDGFGGQFIWVAGATGGDDGQTVDGNTTYTSGRWVRIISGDCNVGWWGAYGDNSHDDKTYIENAVAYAKSVGKAIILPNGTFSISASLDFQQVPVIFDKSAAVSWTNFSPDMTAIIQPGDLSRHFIVGTSSDYVPKLPSGSEAKAEWFGAVADGATDDANAINQAIKAVSFNQGSVSLDGTYAIKDDIYAQSNVVIQGTGIVKPAASHTCQYIIGSGVTKNVTVKGLTIDGNAEAVYGIGLAGNDHVIEGCTVKNCTSGGITAGIYQVYTDQTNTRIMHNVLSGNGTTEQIDVGGSGNIKDVIISDNALYGEGIKIQPEASYGLNNVTIQDNQITAGQINVDTPSTIDGKLTIIGNSISDATAIKVAMNDEAGMESIDIVNNTITNAGLGIELNNIGSRLFVHNNTISGLADSTGIKESAVTDASYGTNLFYGVSDWYNVSEPRYCTLGTNLRSQIDGDTTCSSKYVGEELTTLKKTLLLADGTNVSSASTITLPQVGNKFHITGADTVNLVESSGWTSGSTVNLVCDNTCVITHNASPSGTAYPILLSAGLNLSAAKDDALTLTLDGTRWLETSYISSAGGSTGTVVVQLKQQRTTNWSPWPFDATCTYQRLDNQIFLRLPSLQGQATSPSTYWDGATYTFIPRSPASFPWTVDGTIVTSAVVTSSGKNKSGGIKIDSTQWTLLFPEMSLGEIAEGNNSTASGTTGHPAQTIVFTAQ